MPKVTAKDKRVLLCDPQELPAAFDAGATSLQLVMLVSPTCPICLDGVLVIRESLAELGSAEIMIHVVWVPVLKGDSPEAAAGFGPTPWAYLTGRSLLGRRARCCRMDTVICSGCQSAAVLSPGTCT